MLSRAVAGAIKRVRSLCQGGREEDGFIPDRKGFAIFIDIKRSGYSG